QHHANMGLGTSSLLVIALFMTDDIAARVWGITFLALTGAPAPITVVGTKIGDLLSSKPLTHLGKISYSIYLIHWPLFVGVIYLLTHKFHLTSSSRGVFAYGALIGLPLLYLASLLNWTVVEKPMI